MNQEKIDELTAGLAKAITLVDAAKNAAHAELGSYYPRTRLHGHRAVREIESLLCALQDEWAADEHELDEELERHERSRGV
jgi:hypothetical protein